MTYIIITQENCTYCDKAKRLMKDNKISSVSYNIRNSKWVKSLLGMADLTSIPQIWDSEGEYIGGYHDLDKHINSL